eukprot:TRINITY_DN108657_c0_g1_i1.p1 TRINITY_DN108657_c0_g1~~TRINITY_DN108657_c0_g1_i1.p1  ORF type:complete len:317 (-),score=60.02 TRINITY_DN108657_c0_g1_i1:59-1009(-)
MALAAPRLVPRAPQAHGPQFRAGPTDSVKAIMNGPFKFFPVTPDTFLPASAPAASTASQGCGSIAVQTSLNAASLRSMQAPGSLMHAASPAGSPVAFGSGAFGSMAASSPGAVGSGMFLPPTTSLSQGGYSPYSPCPAGGSSLTPPPAPPYHSLNIGSLSSVYGPSPPGASASVPQLPGSGAASPFPGGASSPFQGSLGPVAGLGGSSFVNTGMPASSVMLGPASIGASQHLAPGAHASSLIGPAPCSGFGGQSPMQHRQQLSPSAVQAASPATQDAMQSTSTAEPQEPNMPLKSRAGQEKKNKKKPEKTWCGGCF